MPTHPTQDKTKLLVGVGFFAVFALMIAVTWLSMSTLHAINTSMGDLVRNTQSKTDSAYQMRDLIRQRSQVMIELMNTEDDAAQQRELERFVQQSNRYRALEEELRTLRSNPDELAILDRIRVSDERVQMLYDEALATVFVDRGDTPALKKSINEIRLKELVLLNDLNTLVLYERELAGAAVARNQQSYAKVQTTLVWMLTTAFSFSMIIAAMIIARVSVANKRISHLATHDDLTGLHNRRSFERHLKHTLHVAGRSQQAYGLLYIDLDRFKIVNDTCGHHAGDQLLKDLTTAMGKRLRKGDILARVGGDEFAIIAEATSFRDICLLAEELRKLVAEFEFHYAGQVFHVSLSIGVTPIDGNGEGIDVVLAEADSACYVAKETGRNRINITDAQNDNLALYKNSIAGVQSIRNALRDERLTLYFQPVFDISGKLKRMTHCEVLLRIIGEDGRLSSPSTVIPIAEKFNLMADIDRWVFDQVITWLADHHGKYRLPMLMLNLSTRSALDSELNDHILEQLARSDIDASCLAFEIATSALTNNPEQSLHFFSGVRALGSSIVLEDIGTGLSRLNTLKELQADYLKIGESLLNDASEHEVDRENGLRMPAPLKQLVDELDPLQEYDGSNRHAA